MDKTPFLRDSPFRSILWEELTILSRIASAIVPHKKPRNTKTEKRELTKEQKDFNKELSKKRVKVENVLAHVKILRIVKDKNRNYRFGFRENLMKTACGLHNFRQKPRKLD